MGKQEEIESDRDRIRWIADPVGFLSKIVKGDPVATYDWEGHVIGYDRPTIDHRTMAAKALLDKIAPSLKSIDMHADTENTMTFVFQSPVPLPNRMGKIDLQTLDAQAAGDQLGSATNQLVDSIEQGDDEDD
jgi:hypothetical protein